MINFINQYENNYQIWRFVKQCEERGDLYSGTDVMPWCARCGTGISQHEIVTDGYKEISHDSVFVRFPLHGRKQEALIAWTTTPWTLTSNVAAAVHPELVYAQVKANDGWLYYVAMEAVKQTMKVSSLVCDFFIPFSISPVRDSDF